jgi:prevent-host-death family protein
MTIANIHEAKSQLSKLVDRALQGEDVIIARAGTPVIRLVPISRSEAPRQGGQWKGKVRIAEDFDELPDDIARAFGMDADRPGPA